MIEYDVIDESYEDYEDGRLVRLKTSPVLEDKEIAKIVIAQGTSFAAEPKVGIFDPVSGELILEALDEEAALSYLVRISENLELQVSKSH